jgi:hypothetical protein
MVQHALANKKDELMHTRVGRGNTHHVLLGAEQPTAHVPVALPVAAPPLPLCKS